MNSMTVCYFKTQKKIVISIVRKYTFGQSNNSNFYLCSIEDRIKQMESRIVALVEESCILSARSDPDDDAVAKSENDLGQVKRSR